MSLKLNFFPLHFVVSLLVLIGGVIAYGDIIYVYLSSNIYLNLFINALFVFAILWSLGVLSYFSRSTKVLNRLLSVITPSSGDQKNEVDGAKVRKQALYVASSVAGTLVDSPVVSRILSSSMRSGKLAVSYSDALVVISVVQENGHRIIAPVKFLAGIFTMLGLLGTFLGLLDTIDGVGNALASVSDVANIDVLALVKLFSEPLKGMSIAFSASLFALVSSLFSNYGVFVCDSKLSALSNRLKNFLTVGAAASSDPNQIEAKDILISLDESFGRLYNGLAERLDVIADGIFAMSKAVVRTQERQEKLFKVIVDNFASMEQVWGKIPEIVSYLKCIPSIVDDLEDVLLDQRDDFLDYMDDEVVKYLKIISDAVEDTADLSDSLVETSQVISENTLGSMEASRVIADVSEIALPVWEESRDRASDIATMTENVVSLSQGQLSNLESINNLSVDHSSILTDIATVSVGQSQILTDIASISVNEVDAVKEILDNTSEQIGILNSSLDVLTEGSNTISEILAVSQEGNVYLDNTLSVVSELKEVSANTLDGINDLLTATVDNVNIQLDVRRFLDVVNKNIGDIASGSFRTVIDNISEKSDILVDVMNSVYSDVNFISDRLSEYTQDVISNMELIIEGVNVSNDLSNSILNKVVGVDYSDYLNDIAYELEGYKEYSDKLFNTLEDLVVATESIVDKSSAISSNTESLVSSFELSNQLSETINDNIVSSTDLISENLSSIHSSSEEVVERIGELSEVASDINSELTLSNDALQVLNSKIVSSDVFTQSIEDLKSDLDSNASNLIDVVSSVNDTLVNNLVNQDELFANIDDVKTEIGLSNTLLQEFNDSNGDYLDKVIEEVGNLESTARELSKQSTEFMLEGFDSIGNNFAQSNKIAESNGKLLNELSMDLKQDVLLSQSIVNSVNKVDYSLGNLHDHSMEVERVMTNLVSGMGETVSALGEVVESVNINSQNSEIMTGHVVGLSSVVTQAMYGLSAMSSSLQQDMGVFSSNFVEFKDKFDSILNTFQSNVESITNAALIADELQGKVYDLSKAVEFLTPVLENMVYATQDSTAEMYSLHEVFSSIDTASNSVSDNVVSLVSGIEFLSNQLSMMSDASLEFNQNTGDVLSNISDLIEGSSNREDNISSAMESLVNEFGELKSSYSEDLMHVTSMISESLDGILSSFDYIMHNTNEFGTLVDRLGIFIENNQDFQREHYSLFEELSNRLFSVSEFQVNSFDGLSSHVDHLNEGILSASREFVTKLDSFENILNSQAKMLSSVEGSMSSIDESRNGFLSDVSFQYGQLQNSVAYMVERFSNTADSLSDITMQMSRQLEVSEMNLEMSKVVSESVNDLLAYSDSIRLVSNNMSLAAETFAGVQSAMERMEGMILSQQNELSVFSSSLTAEIGSLTTVLNTFSDLISNRQDIPELYAETVKLVDGVTIFVNKFDDFASRSQFDAQSTAMDINSGLENLSNMVGDIKSSLVEILSDQLGKDISSLSNKQGEFTEQINALMPKLIEGLEKLASNENANLSTTLVALLEGIAQGRVSDSLRLDLIANAIDSLITEILNSRDVSESMLDVLSEIAGLSRE